MSNPCPGGIGRRRVAVICAAAWCCIAADVAPVPAGTDYGAGLTLTRTVALADVLARPGDYADTPILLTGRISDVCQRKGCWTILSDGAANIRVRFKDYGFFLPTDASGDRAYIEGIVEVETLSERTARHYASESRNGDPAAIQGPQREVGFTASGVRLIDRD